ncbi:MAG: M20/M25/M40 family metallo-hydrolase, partial [candidate division Zixibacteria bacterium]|nr:M20/M25/M40 family metallo-hydrolase [candidate division Zixibacteria bacterium]
MTPYEYLEQTEKNRLDDLFRFLQFPSVSAKSEHRQDLIDCAGWLKDHLNSIGFKTEVCATGGHPVVYGEYVAGSHVPTVLYYGHYDVQPPEPLELWKTPPFEPRVEGGYIWGRGSADDKGQLFAHVKGLEAILKTDGALPMNVKL